MGEIALILLVLWAVSLAGLAIWTNRYSYEEIREAERHEEGPWPKE